MVTVKKEIVWPKPDQIIEDPEKMGLKELEAMIKTKTKLKDDLKLWKKVGERNPHSFLQEDNLIVDLWTDETNYELWEPGLGLAKYDGGSVPVQ